MRVEPIIAVQLAVFLGMNWAILGWLTQRVRRATTRPSLATLIYLIWLVIAPFGLLYLFVPLTMWLFKTYPALQSAAWDVGLVVALSLGVVLSYLLAVVIGIWAIRRFFRVAPNKEFDHVC